MLPGHYNQIGLSRLPVVEFAFKKKPRAQRIRRPPIVARILPYLIIATPLMGCDRPPQPGERDSIVRDPRIAFVAAAAGDPRWPAVEGAFRAYVGRYPTAQMTILQPTASTPAAMQSACENAVAAAPHAICIWVDDPESARAGLSAIARTRCNAALIAVGNAIESEALFARVSADSLDAAELLGHDLATIAGESKSYVLLHANGRDERGTGVYRRFDTSAAGHRFLSRLTEEFGSGDVEAESDAVQSMIRTFPNVGLVVTLNPHVWYRDPRASVLRPANRFVTLSAAPLLWPALREGKAAGLVGWIDGDIGTAAAQMAVRSLAEHRKTDRTMVMRPELVTADRLPDFIRRYEAAARGETVEAPAAASQP
ncbi:MAG: sugar ABC transporter substrate-binding protein [Planctomycetes bacterium]|nr:sugar ABC transporter substrate-binding protein [Planctomycetota bacterium]